MPIIRRKEKHRREYGEIHRQQLREGFDAEYQRFGRSGVRCRRRYGATDCDSDDMAAVESAWHVLRDELLEGVDDPTTVWAYRRFEQCHD